MSNDQEDRSERNRLPDYLNLVETIIVAIDAEGRITAVNRKACTLLGWSEDELVGRSWFETCLPQPEGLEEFYPRFRSRLAGESELLEYFEGPVVTRDGDQKVVAWHITRLPDEEGGPGGLLVAGNDVTERKRAENELRVSRQLLEEIIHHIPARVFWKDLDLRYRGCNAAFARDAGFDDPAEVVGKDDFELIWREQAEAFRADDRQVIETGRPKIHIEEPLRTASGDTLTLLTSKVPLRGADGEVYGILGTYTDITVRKRMEDELRESEARFRALIENASDGITILDEDGANRYLSPAAERITGYGQEELKGTSAFDFVHPDDLDRAATMWETVLEEPGAVVTEELRFRHKDGSWRILECTDSNLMHDPAVGGIVINTRDVTERRELEAQLRHSQRMEAVGRLAGGIAHDFNNLLTVIQGQMDLMLSSIGPSHELEQDIQVVRRAAKRAARLTRQLLAVGREQVLRPRIVDLNQVVRGLEELFARVLGEDVLLEIDLEEDLPSVEIDPGQLEQVIMNLAVNARAAMPEGGRLRLATRALRPEPDAGELDAVSGDAEPGLGGAPVVVSLAVTDTGHGMDRETLKRIFEPFFTTRRGEGGTGLGLSVSYGIVRQSGGTIDVESQVGRGTTFELRFPEAAPRSRPKAPSPVPEDTSAPGVTTGTILLVEDDRSVRHVTRRILERAGFGVRTAEDAEQALAALESDADSIDLMLTDLVLPGARGGELVLRVRERFPSVRMLAMSGHVEDSADVREGMPPDVGFLQKPFSMKKLIRTVQSKLAR